MVLVGWRSSTTLRFDYQNTKGSIRYQFSHDLNTAHPSSSPLSLPSHPLIHVHTPFSCHRERFLALSDVPVIHPHTLPHHRTLILHVCYLLLGTAGGRSGLVSLWLTSFTRHQELVSHLHWSNLLLKVWLVYYCIMGQSWLALVLVATIKLKIHFIKHTCIHKTQHYTLTCKSYAGRWNNKHAYTSTNIHP